MKMSNVTFIHKGAVLKGYFDPFCTELRSPVPIIYPSHYPNCGVDLLMGEAQKHSEGTGKRKKEQREKEGGREGGRRSSSLFVSFPNGKTVLGLSCYR